MTNPQKSEPVAIAIDPESRLGKANLKRIRKGRLTRTSINLRKIRNRKVTHRLIYEWAEVRSSKGVPHLRPVELIGLTQLGVDLRNGWLAEQERKAKKLRKTIEAEPVSVVPPK